MMPRNILFIFFVLLYSTVSFAAEIDHYISRQTASPQTNTLSRATTLIVGTPVSGTIGSGATTSEGWLDSTNFTAGQHYLLLAWSKLNTSSTSKMHLLQAKHGTTPFGSSQDIKETENTSTSFMTPYFWFNVWTAVTGEDIDLYFGGWNAGNDNRVSDATLIALDLSDLSFDGTCDSNGAAGQNFYCTGDISPFAQDGSLTTTPTTKASLNFTPANDGDAWWIVGFVQGNVGTTETSAISGQLTVDGTVRDSFSVEGENAIENPLYTMGYVTTFNADSTTISIQISETAADETWNYASIFALRLNAFSQVLFSQTNGASGEIPAFPTLSNMKTLTSVSNVKTSTWIRAAGSMIDDNAALVTCSLTDEADTDILALAGGGTHETTDIWPHTLFYATKSLSSGTLKGTKYKCTEQSSTSNNLNDAWLLNFSLDLATTTISGTSNLANGKTVKLAIGGVLQSNTVNPTVSSSAWSVPVGALSNNQSIIAWNDGELGFDNEAVAVTKYTTPATTVSGMVLNASTITLGSSQNSTVSFSELDDYDQDNDGDIFYTANGTTLTINPAATLAAPVVSVKQNNTWSVTGGSEIIIAPTIVNAGTITVAGVPGKGDFTITTLTNQDFSTLTYTGKGTGGVIDMKFHDGSNPFVVYNLTLAAPALSGDIFTMEQAYDIGGTLTVTSDSFVSQLVGNINLAGNLANSSKQFDYPSAGDFYLDGTLPQSITTNGLSNGDYSYVVSNPTTVTFVDNFTISGFYDTTSGSTLVFNAGDTYTIANVLQLQGTPSMKINIRSDSAGSQFTFDVPGFDQRAFFVDVKDAATSSNDIFAYSSTNSGNNDSTAATPHWEFHPLVGSVMNIE